jgi:hypothetical protein
VISELRIKDEDIRRYGWTMACYMLGTSFIKMVVVFSNMMAYSP